MKAKKIIAIGAGALLLGGLIAGCTPQKSELEKTQEELGVTYQKLNDMQAQLNTEKQITDDLDNQKSLLEKERDSLKLQLDEKDKTLLTYEQQTAAKEELEESEVATDIELNTVVPDVTVNHYDILSLQKGSVEFDSESYDFEEVVDLSGLKVVTSLKEDEELGDKPYLYFPKEGSIAYKTEVKDLLKYKDVSEDEPLVLPFLGKKLTIVSADEDSFTYKEAQSFFLKEGDKIVVNDEPVTIVAVAEKKVMLEVGAVKKTVGQGNTALFGKIQVRVKDVLYRDYGDKFVEIDVGTDVLKTVSDGDEFVKDDETFVWSYKTEGDFLSYVGVRYDVKADNYDEEVLKTGESLNFVNYFELKFGLKEEYKYNDATLSFTTVTEDDVAVVKVQTSEDGLKFGSKRLDKAYLAANNKVYYKEEGKWKTSTESLYLVNDDMKLNVSYNGTAVLVGDSLTLPSSTLEFLGVAKKDAESKDVMSGNVELGNRENDVLLSNGIVIKSPETNAEKDTVEFKLPNKVVKVELHIVKK